MTRQIGYFVPEFPQQTHAFFWREAAALRDLGCEPVFFSTRRPPAEACPHAFGAEARASTHYTFPPRAAAFWRLLRNPVATLRAIGYVAGLSETPLRDKVRCLALIPSAADLAESCRDRGISHVHIHSFANSAHVGALARRLGGPDYSLTLHGDPKVYGCDHAAKAADATLITTVTRPLAKAAADFVPEQKIAVISMGVDTETFRSPPDRDNRPPGAPLVCATVARLHPLKGHSLFLQAMAQLRDEGLALRYLIAGSGPAEAQIRAEAARLGLDSEVEFLGPIGETAVAELFRNADVAVLPSVMPGEAAPVMVMEAMACGTPVICSRIGGTPEMIEDGVDGFLVAQGDVSAIADATRHLATDPERRKRMSAAARASAVAQFDYRRKAADLLDAINGTSGNVCTESGNNRRS